MLTAAIACSVILFVEVRICYACSHIVGQNLFDKFHVVAL